MASYEQAKYCPNCKKNVSASKEDRCNICGARIERGLWSVRFRIETLNGIQHKRLSGYHTKKDAQQAHIDFISNYTPIIRDKTNTHFIFEDLLQEYFRFCMTDNEESTMYDKKTIFNLFIIPYFKNKDLNKISKQDLLLWQNHIWTIENKRTKTTYSWKYLIKIRGCLNHFLTFCENIYDIPNKLRQIKPPKNKEIKKEMKFWELETFNTFIDSVDDVYWKTLWMTFMYTGARFNEIRALSDEDIIDNTISINKSLCGKKVLQTPNRTKITKNNKTITKQIPDVLANQIKIYKNWKEENKIPSTFLFGGGNPISEGCLRRRLVKDTQKANVSYLNPHGFRHSYVSLLMSLGVSSKIIAELIGDREIQIIETYGHLYKDAKHVAISLLNNKISTNRS